jgi:hypothetical protein
MVKPRYDAEEDVSRHGAASKKDCEKMEKKYGWRLKDVEKIKGDTLKVDCVFDGETEFPRRDYEND